MADIDSLRLRIEQAELRLKVAHTARQRESAALASMWDQIRERFAAQSAEIVRLREQVTGLQDSRDELHGMIRTLLGAVESSIERMADETVPQITGLAESLLEADAVAIPGLPAAERRHAHPAKDDGAKAPEGDFRSALAAHLDDGNETMPPSSPTFESRPVVADAPVSPGIRDLITRIEGAFEIPESASGMDSETDGEQDDGSNQDLARDLDDIRRLRSELQNLRTRMGASH